MPSHLSLPKPKLVILWDEDTLDASNIDALKEQLKGSESKTVSLDIRECQVNWVLLFETLRPYDVHTLFLPSCNIDDQAAAPIAQYVAQNAALVEINLRDNQLTNKGAELCLEALAECQVWFSLDFSLNKQLNSGHLIQTIDACLKKHPCYLLDKLELDPEVDVKNLSRFINENKQKQRERNNLIRFSLFAGSTRDQFSGLRDIVISYLEPLPMEDKEEKSPEQRLSTKR